MAITGAIAARVKGLMPLTWDALSRDSRYGETSLQGAIDTAKERALGSVISTNTEALLPLIVVDYVAKIVVIDLVTPGVDFWMNQPLAESATGTAENHTFTDRAAQLQKLRADLLVETKRIWPEVSVLINYRRLTNASRPRINTLDDDFLTPSPQEFPRPYVRTDRS